MKPLSNTQRRILTAASKDTYSPVEKHMDSIKSPAVRRQVIYSMLCSGYVIEDDSGHLITSEGIEALSSKKVTASKPAKKEKQKKLPAPRAAKVKEAAEAKSEQPAEAPAPASDAKSDKPAEGRQLLINMMSRDEGATSQQMVEATGWQKGAIGGTLSKIRKLLASRNQMIASEKNGSGTLVYKIADKQAA